MVNKKELIKAENELCDEFILNTEKMDLIMQQHIKSMKGFHQYSIRNLILANSQHYNKTGESIDQLASYKKWQSKNRYVRKGEKALWVLAPRTYEEKDEFGEVIKTGIYFVGTPVFDISQTDGEDLEKDYTSSETEYTFEEIVNRVKGININVSNKVLTRGYTDGEEIWVSKHISDLRKICVLFHELAHYHLHFDKDRNELTSATKELEAEAIAYMVASAIGIKNDESSFYIRNWAGKNAHEEIKGKGKKLINTAEKILKDLHLKELYESKKIIGNNYNYLINRMTWNKGAIV